MTDGTLELVSPAIQRGRCKAFIRNLTRIAAGLVLAISLAGYLADTHPLFELTCHFKTQYLALAAACALLAVLIRDWRGSAIGLVAVALNGAVILPWYLNRPNPSLSGHPQPLRLLLSNVYTDNRQSAELLKVISAEQPDLLVLEEVNERWMAELAPLQTVYPYSKWVPRSDNFGIAVLSRIPLSFVHEVDLGSGVPSVLAGFQIGEQSLNLIATHPLPPGSQETYERRNAQLQNLTKLASQSAQPLILIGDLNVTPWSPDYRRLAKGTGLINARQGHGILPTWPAFFGPLMIPLDQCLVSPAIKVSAIRTGPDVGSDHLPLMVDLAVGN